jgi:S-adenosyl methyltransferase
MTDNATVPSNRSVPVGVDPTRASIARVYDAFLNGKDNYEVDREVVAQVTSVAPQARDIAAENRNFLIRVCRFVAAQTGIEQFLDCGSGLPTAENVHQVVQRINPDSVVVYVDNDPVVLAHGRALLEENEQTHLVDADIFNPRDVLEHQDVQALIDFKRPLAFFQMGTLHHYNGPRETPKQIMREFIDALPSGSYVAISHFFDPENEHSELAGRTEEMFLHSPMGSGTFRTRAELLELFDGLELVDPGLTLCADWWPDGPRLKPLNPSQYLIAGAVGRKP